MGATHNVFRAACGSRDARLKARVTYMYYKKCSPLNAADVRDQRRGVLRPICRNVRRRNAGAEMSYRQVGYRVVY